MGPEEVSEMFLVVDVERTRRTNSDVADTALSSDVFALASACDVVTSKKFVRSVGSAAHIDTPATKRPIIVERIVKQCR